jgi:signal transduction histidine kinase
MELDVLLREAPPSTLDGTRERLARIQRALGQDILAVRDLMQSLKPVEVDPRRLPEHLAAMVREFHDKTGVNARLSSSLDEVDLPRRVCGEIVRAVQEALANVRKHSGAENVLVQLAAENAHLELVIEDDGKGFDFEGRLTGDQLDARHRSPVALRERVRAIRGQLAIDSRPGRGARVEITIPR